MEDEHGEAIIKMEIGYVKQMVIDAINQAVMIMGIKEAKKFINTELQKQTHKGKVIKKIDYGSK